MQVIQLFNMKQHVKMTKKTSTGEDLQVLSLTHRDTSCCWTCRGGVFVFTVNMLNDGVSSQHADISTAQACCVLLYYDLDGSTI